MTNCELEDAYYGERIGTIELYQISAQQFQLECLSSNLSAGDSTGLRAYHGSHVVIRFVATFPHFVNHKNVVELGCGIGVLGLVGTHLSHPALLVLTDREPRGTSIVKKNIQHFHSLFPLSTSPTYYQQMKWSDINDTRRVLDLCSKSENIHTNCYDVVLGSELMYFNTDVELMIQSIMDLTNKNGIFIHGHLFRMNHQVQQFIQILSTFNWTTIEIPHKEFISEEEMKRHGDWYNVKPLISARREVIEKLKEQYPSWKEFTGDIWYREEEEQNESEIFSVFE